MRLACPRCGDVSQDEELGVTLGSVWLHCSKCSHVWRESKPNPDAFETILARVGPAMPPGDECPPQGRPRATRFQTRLYVLYRSAAAQEWRHGLIENISRSGVLIRTREPVDPASDVEMILTLPRATTGDEKTRIRTHGAIVHAQRPENAPEALVAAAVAEYAFEPAATAASPVG